MPAGRTNDATVLAAVDLFPTLGKLCGAELPKGYASGGAGLGPALLGKSAKRARPLFWEYGRNATGPVVAVASGIYAGRAFEDLPVLGDALEDAGCADADFLGHCRGGGRHARGCWAVDLVLGRT